MHRSSRAPRKCCCRPGVSPQEPIVAEARSRGIEVLGDIEVFARAAAAPVIGVTGTNGKSTVTSLVARMAEGAGLTVLAGGNFGKPALDLLEQPVPDLYVLELSSFQLETTTSLELLGAVVLNISADHMDRYTSLAEYARAKARIFSHAATVVLNADDPFFLAMRQALKGRPAWAQPPRLVTFSTERSDADFTLMREGREELAGAARRGPARHRTHENSGSPQRGERAGGARPRRVRGIAHPGDAAGDRSIPGLEASLRVGGGRRRRALHRRLEGHQRGCDDRRGERPSRRTRGHRRR